MAYRSDMSAGGTGSMPEGLLHRSWMVRSGNPLRYHMTGHIRQTVIATLGAMSQAQMIEAKLMQHGCVQIVGVDRFFSDSPADLIRVSINCAAFQPATGKQCCIRVRMMITTGVGITPATILTQWRAAKFRSEDDHR